MTSENNIIVCASAGALARHLALVIDYAVNQDAEQPDFSRRVNIETPEDPSLHITEKVSPVLMPRSTRKLWDHNAPEPAIPVLYTTQETAKILDQYPDSIIIDITTQPTNRLQQASNYVIEECIRSVGILIDRDLAIVDAKKILGIDTFDQNTVFADPQFADHELVQILIVLLANRPAFMSSRASIVAPSTQYLALAFDNICPAGNRAINSYQAVDDLMKFLDKKTVRSTDQVFAIWHRLLSRLNDSIRLQLNTGNWSN